MSIAMDAVAQLPIGGADTPAERIGKVKAKRRIIARRDREQAPERR
ncbi:MAG: hypothetical protein M3Q15_01970 [Pseudomonadota bacterium]|nr:hypothetical protein [Pseudomonadota bacterium]